MELPCCGGIEQAVKTALQRSGKFTPWQVVTLSTQDNPGVGPSRGSLDAPRSTAHPKRRSPTPG